MSLEDNLRDSLERRAGTVAPAANVADVHARATGRDRQTRRLLVAGLAVALLAGPLAGFAVAQSLADDVDPTVSAVGGGDVTTPTTVVTSPEEFAQSTGSPILPLGTDEPLEQLFRRTTDDGIVIRAYRQTLCKDVEIVAAGLSNESAVAQVSTWFDPSPMPITVVGGGVFGVDEGSPVWWVAVRLADNATNVRAESDDSSDEMDVVGGVALLASRFATSAGPTLPPPLTLLATDASGTEIATIDVPSTMVFRSGAIAECIPGVTSPTPTVPLGTLPPPGEQPADAATARAAIEQAFATMHDGTKTEEERLSSLVVGHGLTDLFRRVTATWPEGVEASSGRVTDIVFTSPTEATVLYDILSEGAPQFAGRLGGAVLVDGRWRITRETACSELLLAAVTCPPG